MKKTRKKPQKEKILNYLMEGNKLTQIDAFELFGCFRLASRIHDLRLDGHNIKTKTTKSRNATYASYYLENTRFVHFVTNWKTPTS
jgi:hypothetical protein